MIASLVWIGALNVILALAFGATVSWLAALIAACCLIAVGLDRAVRS